MPVTGKILGQRVRAAREAAGLTQEELAQRASVGGNTSASRQSAMSRIEHFGELTTSQLERLATETGKPMGYFLAIDLARPGAVSLRAGDADVPEIASAIDRWTRLIDDYEFLMSLPE